MPTSHPTRWGHALSSASRSEALRLHASCVALNGRAVLITGRSGSGKSTLALQLLALGCDLVGDDAVDVLPDLTVRSPHTIRGKIEARGVGLLKADAVEAELAMIVDLDQVEEDRLPPWRTKRLHNREVPLLYRVDGIHFVYAIRQYLLRGRSD
ncbi:HPr kinase/phosphorylase [Marivivens aquimaris]|uniref:HPr kinase/phosphorylase n=1 Tax=Marivivens aquimaris TaxID=2774876 RepID=UPI0018825F03|nr:HPr kinase/phosphatase C-terminal domain-containing protein [Marivivens aquimaris]